jgi:hypothetical protein
MPIGMRNENASKAMKATSTNTVLSVIQFLRVTMCERVGAVIARGNDLEA